jgi:uncharacterized caspase-like protein
MIRAVLLLLLAACAPKPALRARGLSDATSTATALRETLAPRRVALLVGIDAYTDPLLPDLRHAAADATALGEVLRQPDAGFDEVLVLADADGTPRSRVFEGLRRLAATVQRDDELVVFFAGHGTRVPVDGGEHRFLLPSDARTTDLVGSAIDLEDLLDYVLTLPPLRKGVIVDACFDGGGRSVTRPGLRGFPAAALHEDEARLTRLGPGDAQLFATTPGRPSLEDDTLGHGVYTWYLLEALGWGFRDADRDGDGLLTLWEAHDHARGQVVAHTHGAQVPEAILRTVGEADVVLRGTPGARRRRDAALLYLYDQPGSPLAGATISVDGRARGALPGTIPVDAGRHEVVVTDRSGHVVADGWIELGVGRAYRVDQLAAKVEGERGGAEVRAIAVAAPGLGAVLGPAAVGVEVALDGRLAPVRAPGLVLGGRLGLGAALGGAEGLGARTFGSVGVDLGWRGDVGRLRWGLGWGATGWWLPPRGADGLAVPVASPDRAGWAFAATGPRAQLAVVVEGGWSVGLSAAAEGTGLVLSPGARTTFVPVVTAGVGARARF